MRCFFTLTISAALAVGLSTASWSQTGGAGAGGGAGGAGTSGASASGGAGAAGTTNAAGASGATGTAGAAGTTGNTGNVGAAGTAGNVGAGTAVRGGATGTPRRPVTISPDAANRNNGTENGSVGLNRRRGLISPDNTGNINQTPFFNDPGVRQQLNLNNAQANSLNRAYGDAFTRYNQGLTNLNNNANLTDQQRALQQQQLEAQFNQNFSGSLNNNTLYNPQMRARLNQLNRQFQGASAFNDPTVQQQLNLSQDQVRQFRTLQANWRQQMQQFRNRGANGATDPAQWSQLQQQFASQLNGVLTPAQQQIWAQQTGQAYMFSPNAYFNDTAGVPNGTSSQSPIVNGTSSIPATGGSTSIPATGGTTSIPATGTTAPASTTPSTAQGTQGGTVR